MIDICGTVHNMYSVLSDVGDNTREVGCSDTEVDRRCGAGAARKAADYRRGASPA